ncbi:hypothetical protein LCGC14_2418840 [marine sediment metagenome]|uniref:Uncharacterized protein n=1 Tax=marine sediment metagenome TaxID=412755 RepID=A0A0F9E2D9_9ZZZZ
MTAHVRMILDDHELCVELIHDRKKYFFGWMHPRSAVHLFDKLSTLDGVKHFLNNIQPHKDNPDELFIYENCNYSIDENVDTPIHITTLPQQASLCAGYSDDLPFLIVV